MCHIINICGRKKECSFETFLGLYPFNHEVSSSPALRSLSTSGHPGLPHPQTQPVVWGCRPLIYLYPSGSLAPPSDGPLFSGTTPHWLFGLAHSRACPHPLGPSQAASWATPPSHFSPSHWSPPPSLSRPAPWPSPTLGRPRGLLPFSLGRSLAGSATRAATPSFAQTHWNFWAARRPR